MPVVISITPEDIAYAEKILLPEGKTFDDERRNFITNLDTIDLQAVPGSGKTTALLAKLLILERYLPFEDGSGILVISHTNAAVDEIKKKIGSYCPKLSSYPNFIGTIQSFVDQFLAIPYGQNHLKTRISWIDSERYKEALWNEFNKIYWNTDYEKPGTLFYGRLIQNAKAIAQRTGGSESTICNDLIIKEVQDLYFDFNDEKIKFFRDDSTLLATKTNKKYQGIKQSIENVIQSGTISYEYAYKFANHYIALYPSVIDLLQKRFKYVFVDEMQDMDTDQYNLLEKLFYNGGANVFQRIGDKNQAIYNGSVKIQSIWTNRPSVLPLNGSHRLPPHVADIVNCFALEREAGFNVNGLGETAIPVHIIVYDNVSISNVISRYIQIIRTYQESDHIPLDSDHPFKAIAWNADWKNPEDIEDADKIRLVEYHRSFRRKSHNPKNEYSSLLNYLRYYDRDKKTLEPIRKNILNAILKVLRLESVVDEKERYYTKRKLITQLRENITGDFYENFNQLIYNASIEVIKGHEDAAYQLIKDFIPELLTVFGKSITNSAEFINADIQAYETAGEEATIDSNNPNIIEQDGIRVEIGTVHSSKGQTHTCTLYLETYYQGDYESTRLAEQFKGQGFPVTENRTYHQQSTVMLYVGLSRPTHLLCVAVHRDRFNEHLVGLDTSVWKIIRIDQ
jgi:DNA helicase II / ATP-dependent DNA helicase PcrA